MTRNGPPRSAETRAKIGAKNLGNSRATRADDEAILEMLRLRDCWGWDAGKIAQYLGRHDSAIRMAMNRVDAAIAATESLSDGKAA